MIFRSVIYCLLLILSGFAAGRFGDKYGGQIFALHHWIYGFLLLAAGIIFLKFFKDRFIRLALTLAIFGISLFISDWSDFSHGLFLSRDLPHEWYFWSFK